LGKAGAVAQDPNSDVDRAMSALGGTSIPYRTFTHVAATNSTRPADNIADFPLLASALPAAAPFHVPRTRTPGRDNSENSPMGNSLAIKANVAVTDAQASARSKMLPNAPQPAEQARGPEKLTPSSSVNRPFRHPPQSSGLQPHMGGAPANGIDSRKTPLEAVFRTLHAAKPPPEPRTETQTRLQNIFSIL
jgi:hypothetical protein